MDALYLKPQFLYYIGGTLQKQLFPDTDFDCVSPEQSLQMMEDWNVIQVDTETSGRDAHLSNLLCIQFGNDKADARLVIDTSTIDIRLYKELLESKKYQLDYINKLKNKENNKTATR